MDEHDKRAREVLGGVYVRDPAPWQDSRVDAVATALRETAQAARDAERERCKAIVSDAHETAMGHATPGDACGWLDTVREEIASGRSVEALREWPDATPTADPAQAARDRFTALVEAAGDLPACERCGRVVLAGACCVDPVEAERARIAARLLARAAAEDDAARQSSERGWFASANQRRGAADALRAEAAALTEGT